MSSVAKGPIQRVFPHKVPPNLKQTLTYFIQAQVFNTIDYRPLCHGKSQFPQHFQSCKMGLAHVNIDVVMASYMISDVVEGNATGMASGYL